MALSKRTVIEEIRVDSDGQVWVYETIEIYEGGFVNGTRAGTGPRTGRVIDVGDAVAGENQLIRDVVNGNLHSAARKTARDAVKAAQGE